MTRVFWYLTLVFVLAYLYGCGGEIGPSIEDRYSTTGPVCYQDPTWTFHADICPDRLDIGLCTWETTDGRTLHIDGCITRLGVTCVKNCIGL